MLLKLRLTFRVVFFYSAMYVVCAAILLYKNLVNMMKKMGMELKVVWSHHD